MHTHTAHSAPASTLLRVTLATLMLLLGTLVAQEGEAPAATPEEGAAQSTYASPEEASQALIEACKADDPERLVAIFGPDHRNLIETEDRALSSEHRRNFVARCGEALNLQKQDDGTVVMVLGTEAWPFPIPLVQEAGSWHFDTEAGAEEILDRWIGENELQAIEACKAYVEAQLQYASTDRDGDGVLEFAQRLASTFGQQDGLYWEADEESGEELSPFGPLLAAAADYAENREAGAPWYGYHYRILTRQGEHPPGGVYSYLINSNLIGGHALLAYPADYGQSGVMSFLVSHHGKIYEKDLGEATAEIVDYIKEFDPDESWKLVTSE